MSDMNLNNDDKPRVDKLKAKYDKNKRKSRSFAGTNITTPKKKRKKR